MTKLISAAVFLLFSVSQVKAQKFDRENLHHQNTHIPSKLIYDQIKNYGVSVNIINTSFYSYDYNAAIAQMPSLTSYDKVEFSNAHLKVDAALGPFSSIEEKTITTTTEEEVNKQKVKVTYYKRVFSFRFPMSYKAVNGKNQVLIYSNGHAGTTALSVETGNYKTETEAVNYMNTNRATMVKAYLDNMGANFLRGSNGALLDQVDFYPSSTILDIFKIKKWDKDDEYNAHVENVIKQYKTLTADEGAVVAKDKIAADLTYFSTFEGVFNPKDKKEDILYFVNYYNLATVYYCLDDFEKARYYLQKLDSSDKNERSTSMLKSFINIASSRSSKHFLTTTHLNYNPVKDYRLADKTFTSDASSTSEKVSASISGGAIEATDEITMIDKTVVKGKLVFDKEKNALLFFTKEAPDKPQTITPGACLQFTKDGKNYVVAKTTLNGTPTKQYFEVLHKGERIYFLKSVTGSLDADPSGLMGFLKTKDDLITYYNTPTFTFKKKMADYFEDCPALSEKAKDGGFGTAAAPKKIAEVIELLKEYDACK